MDHTLSLSNTLILGMPGSGKTTFAIRYLLNAPAACRFVFDWNDRFAPRLGLRPCYTAEDLERALPSRWVIFNPSRMFPGAMFDKKVGTQALKYFAAWVRAVSKRGPGKKFFACAEVWNFCTEDSIPTELAMLAQDGRQDQVELVLDTQRPEKLNPSLIGACTELVCFRLASGAALKAAAAMDAEPGVVESLPLGSFVSYNRLAWPGDPGAKIEGKLF